MVTELCPSYGTSPTVLTFTLSPSICLCVSFSFHFEIPPQVKFPGTIPKGHNCQGRGHTYFSVLHPCCPVCHRKAAPIPPPEQGAFLSCGGHHLRTTQGSNEGSPHKLVGQRAPPLNPTHLGQRGGLTALGTRAWGGRPLGPAQPLPQPLSKVRVGP